MPENGGRIESLDALRGMAALVVLFSHIRYLAPDWAGGDLFLNTPLHMLVAGRHAVMLFFVLSGFVLALPYNSGNPAYGPYIVRRLCRIYLPYLAVLTAAYALWFVVARPHPELAPHGGEWSQPAGAGIALSHIFMSGLSGGNILNPPVWSLIVEMRVAFIVPLLVLLVRRWSWAAVAAGAAAGYVAAKLFVRIDGSDNFYMADTLPGTCLLTLYYIPFFMLGVAVAAHRDELTRMMRALPRGMHMAAFAAVLAVPHDWLRHHFTLAELWYAVSSAYLILCCLSFARIVRMLETPVLQWLGRISYSLYLVHAPVLLTVLYLLADTLPLPAILALAFILVFPVAELTYRLVERPAIALGRMLGNRKRPLPAAGSA